MRTILNKRHALLSVLLSAAIMLAALQHFSVPVLAEPAKKLNVYYINWGIYNDLHHKQQVKDLPWDRISTINHAFWLIQPNADHTEYAIVSGDEYADFGEGMCFDQYAVMTAQYPNVTVMLSIGGWVAKWFSEMAATETGRASFVDSCVETLQTYPFLGGIDIDWEYPGTSRNGEGTGYVGSSGDRENFTLLMQALREAFDTAGFSDKILTYCAPTSTGAFKNGTVCIDFAAIDPYVDRVNVMTYDMSGSWTRYSYHHTALYPGDAVENGVSASEAAEYLLSQGVPSEKINIGSPLYSHGWVVSVNDGEDPGGKPVSPEAAYGSLNDGELYWYEIKNLEQSPEWEALYDETSEAAYLYNRDPDSPYYQHFYTYESERSLQAKLDYINSVSLGGLIVWCTPGDAMESEADFPMLTQMAVGLGLYHAGEPIVNEEVANTPAFNKTGLLVCLFIVVLAAAGGITVINVNKKRRL